MNPCLPLSRQGHPTIAHRFIGGFRIALQTQPRQGRQKPTPLPFLHINDLGTNSQILPSLTGLIGLAARTPTVETVGYCRVSLAGQRVSNPEIDFARSRVIRSCPSPEGGHARQVAHVLAKRGYERISLFLPCEV